MTETVKVTVTPFTADNGDLMGRVAQTGYGSSYKKGDIILLHTRKELDDADKHLALLVKMTKAGASTSKILQALKTQAAT